VAVTSIYCDAQVTSKGYKINPDGSLLVGQTQTGAVKTSFGYAINPDGSLAISATKQAGAYVTSTQLTINPDGSVFTTGGSGGGGGSGTINSGTGGFYAWYPITGTAVSSNPNLDDGVTSANTLTYAGSGGISASAGPIQTQSSISAGYLALVGKAVSPSVIANSAGWMAPTSATFTGYALQFPTTAPSGTQYLGCGTPVLGISTCTFNTVSGGGAVSSVSNTDSTLTISPTTGAVIGSLNLAHANAWTATQTFSGIIDSGITASTSPICPNGTGGLFTTVGCAGGGGAVSSVSNSDGTLTITPTTGAVVGSLNLANANTWTGVQTISPTVSGAATTASLTIAPTWNTTGVVDAALTINPTNTASGAGSLLIDAQLAGTSMMTVDKAGNLALASNGKVGGVLTTSNVVLCGGQAATCSSSTAGIVGGALVRGSDNTNTNAAAKSGYAILRGGILNTASIVAGEVEGTSQIGNGYFKGTIANVGDVVCMTTTAFTVTDCPTTPGTNVVGIATNTTNPIGVVSYGTAAVFLDAALTAIGDNVCLSTTTAGAGHDNGSPTTPCALGTAVGVIVASSGSVTQMSGATTGSVTLSTTLVLVQLHISQ
jgi:hypothetical protein